MLFREAALHAHAFGVSLSALPKSNIFPMTTAVRVWVGGHRAADQLLYHDLIYEGVPRPLVALDLMWIGVGKLRESPSWWASVASIDCSLEELPLTCHGPSEANPCSSAMDPFTCFRTLFGVLQWSTNAPFQTSPPWLMAARLARRDLYACAGSPPYMNIQRSISPESADACASANMVSNDACSSGYSK